MKHVEFYVKHKTNYPSLVNPLFSKRNWWRVGLITVIAILIEPLIIYKNQRLVPFSFEYYVQLIQYLLIAILPFVGFLIWINWRELIKRSRGYAWVGKFEVVHKQSSFAFCYVFLTPGENNKVRVTPDLFGKIRAGDFILIRRNALGNVEEISRVNKFSARFTRARRAAKFSEAISAQEN